MRIVSLLPSATEILFALGFDREVVGVSHECDFPPQARTKKVVIHSRIPHDASPSEIDRLVRDHLLLDFPHYTRPAEFRGWPVPDVLLGGNHEEIRRWRRDRALEKTRRNRPDLLLAESPSVPD